MQSSFAWIQRQVAGRTGAALLTLVVQIVLAGLFFSRLEPPRELTMECLCVAVLPRDADAVAHRTMPPSVQFALPVREDAQPPQISIVDQRGIRTLPPRPDPAYPNLSPLPESVGVAAGGSPLIVLVRALVRENGTIGEAEIAGSCGVADLDAYAVAFVKAHWHFLPATENGQAVARWTTLEVPVAR